MKVGVLGSGNVGQVLAKGFQDLWHDVRIGSREGNKLGAFTEETGIPEATFADAAAHGEVIVLALRGDAAEAVVRGVASALAGKLVLDATNPISGPPKDGIVPFFTGPNDSLLERLQAAAPEAKLVKCWSSVGAHLMVKPQLAGGLVPSMFICGNDADAKQRTADILETFGWHTEDVGTAAAGHAVEALCQLWCAPGFLRNDWAHAFAVLRP